jgi:hypothetical protein
MQQQYPNLQTERKSGEAMRACLLGVTLILAAYSSAVAACWTEPRAWAQPDGRPIDLIKYERDRAICRYEASYFYRYQWIATFVGCMRQHGYIPLYRGVFC